VFSIRLGKYIGRTGASQGKVQPTIHSFRHWLFAQEILAAAAEPPSSPPPADTPAAAPQARPLQKNGHGRKPLPASLPRRRVLPAFASDFGEDWR
jgi:hypothetical protein